MKLIIIACWFVGVSYSLLASSAIDGEFIRKVLVQDSTLSVDSINKIDFRDFVFDVGIKGTPRLISNIKGGQVLIKWADDEESVIRLSVFAQRRNDKYVQDLDVPMDILNQISSENSTAALEGKELRESWKKSEIKDIGTYCIGRHLAAYGSSIVSSGYFFNQDYGFCMHISTPEGSGISLVALERIGQAVMKEIANKIKQDQITPNPFTKSEPFVVSKQTRAVKPKQDPQMNESSRIVREIDIPSIKPKPKQTEAESSNIYLGIGATLAALVCAILVWQKISKRKTEGL